MDSQFRGPGFKATGWLQLDSAFRLSEVDQMNTSNSWVLSGSVYS